MAACGDPKRSARPATLTSAAIGRHDPGHDLDERRLAGAVLAQQRVDLAGSHVQVDVVEHDGIAVALAKAGRDQARCRGLRRAPGSMVMALR